MAPTMSSVIIPPTWYPCPVSHSFSRLAPSSPCSSPATAAKTRVARNPPGRAASASAERIDTATPEASSSAPGASGRGSITSEGMESRCPETTKAVFRSAGSVPGRTA